MSTLITEDDSTAPRAGGSAHTCQTDSRTSGNYVLSRLNACTWQNRRETLMACTGSKCPYRFCGYTDEEMPPRGTACLWEVAYAAAAADQFDDLFPSDGIGRHMDDRPTSRREWTLAHLVANRASVRATLALKRCWDAITNRGNMPIDRKPFEEYDLARRYQAAAHNRIEAVWAQLPVIEERVRLQRIRSRMLFYGYWRPDKGEAPPRVEDAPQWIVHQVNQRRVVPQDQASRY